MADASSRTRDGGEGLRTKDKGRKGEGESVGRFFRSLAAGFTAAFGWTVEESWDAEPLQALSAIDALRVRAAQQALLTWLPVVDPEALQEILDPDAPRTIEEKYGPEVAAEAAELEARQREWLASRRRKRRGK